MTRRGRGLLRPLVACAILPGIGFTLAAGSVPADDAALESAWVEGAQLSFDRSAQAFAQLGPRRDARLGRAVMLLNAQPKTEANIAEARRLFTALRNENATDEPGIAALFYLARLAQFHERAPDLAAARGHYEELVRRHDAHFLGQLARFKLVVLTLYDAADPAAPPARLAAAEGWGAGIREPSIARDFHVHIADAYLRFAGPLERALEHLLAADATGASVRDLARALLYVQIAECARELGRVEIARRFYGRFLEEFPRDARGTTIRARLAQLGPGNGA